MIPVYKIDWNNPEDIKQRVSNSVISWSSQNWIAFYTGQVWHKHQHISVDTVFILNPNQPWEVFPVQTDHKCIIEHLQWSEDGTHFISMGVDGITKIWVCDDNLMNQWKCIQTLNFGEGEKVVKVYWVNTRSKYQLDVDKMLHKDISKRFSTKKTDNILLTLTDNSECFVIVLSSGYLKILVLPQDKKQSSYLVRLGSIKIQLLKADVTLSDNGKIFVAAQTGKHSVEIFTVICKHGSNGLEFHTEVWPCIVPHTNTTDKDFQQSFEIANVKCVSMGSIDQVLVSTHSLKASYIQLYEIKKEQVTLHSCFAKQQNSQQSADAAVCLRTLKFQGHFQTFFVTKLRYGSFGKSKDASLAPKLVVIDKDGVFHVYSINNWTQILKPVHIETLKTDCINGAAFSPTDHCLFTLTEKGSAILFLLPHFSTSLEKFKLKNVVNMFHYCFAENYVPWDVMIYLLSCERSFVEQCFQALIDDFGDYSFIYENLFRSAFLNAKAMFYQVSHDYCGVLECFNNMLLLGIYQFVTSQLQSDKEAAVAEAINKICATSKEMDINKLILTLDVKDLNIFFAINSTNRPLIQWITDYTVHLARLILSKNHHGQNWKVVLKYFDSSCFLHLRQLLMILYVTYQKYPNQPTVHPIFNIMANSMDVTAQLFRLVTKLQQIVNGDSSIEIALTDLPFNNLPLMYLEFPSVDPKNGVLSTTKLTAGSQDIDQYVFQLHTDSWDYVHRTGIENPLSCGISTVNTCLRQFYDGINFSPTSLIRDEILRQCSRCGCLTIHQANPSRILNSLWNTCWSKHCSCNGLWKRVEWHD